MVTAFVNITHADLVKEAQSSVEGDILTDAAKFGNPGASQTFLALGPDGARLVSTAEHKKKPRRKAGKKNRNGQQTIAKKYSAQIVFKASDNNVPLQKWCTNESLKTDVDTPAASRVFAQSYMVGANETFEILKGCLPKKTSKKVTKDGVMYTVDLLVKERVQTTSADGGLTTPVWANPDTAAPWLADDGGLNHFTHDGNNYAIEGITIDIEHLYAESNPTELQLLMFANESIRNISGTVDVIKSSSVLSTAAWGDAKKAMSIVLKAATLTDSFTNVEFENPKGLDFDPDNSSAFIESFNFSADTISAA